MSPKSEQLQIRVTRQEKAALRRFAAAAGQDVSAYVLARALPATRQRFEGLLELLSEGTHERYALAELNDLRRAWRRTNSGKPLLMRSLVVYRSSCGTTLQRWSSRRHT